MCRIRLTLRDLRQRPQSPESSHLESRSLPERADCVLKSDDFERNLWNRGVFFRRNMAAFERRTGCHGYGPVTSWKQDGRLNLEVDRLLDLVLTVSDRCFRVVCQLNSVCVCVFACCVYFGYSRRSHVPTGFRKRGFTCQLSKVGRALFTLTCHLSNRENVGERNEISLRKLFSSLHKGKSFVLKYQK